ncbi:hypothetical protein BB8028_0003g00490 [Beauveria bassiana]|uniref:Uncharacterized protein n=1 Tax=Beauveria bassiana TaxID=176275 RepID=A0A2S7Y656_BEABA|nr:hypothetical protein BB8028_0003g00490 [Beauveria bassiana]
MPRDPGQLTFLSSSPSLLDSSYFSPVASSATLPPHARRVFFFLAHTPQLFGRATIRHRFFSVAKQTTDIDRTFRIPPSCFFLPQPFDRTLQTRNECSHFLAVAGRRRRRRLLLVVVLKYFCLVVSPHLARANDLGARPAGPAGHEAALDRRLSQRLYPRRRGGQARPGRCHGPRI